MSFRATHTYCWLFFLLLIGGTGCASYQLDGVQRKLNNSIDSENYDRAEQLLQRSWQNDVYRYKDRVLYYLELGTVRHFSRQYRKSFEAFQKAENFIEDLYTRSINRGIRAFAVNDNILAYEGEDYENIYLNAFNTLNFLHLDDLESALVESRRIAYKLEQLNIRYKGLAGALSEADTTGWDEWNTGSTSIENSALGHFLSGIIFGKSGDRDDARIEIEQTKTAIKEQQAVYNYVTSIPDTLLNRVINPDSYNTLIVSFSGKAPVKVQYDTRLYIKEHDFYLKFSLPKLQIRPTNVRSVRAVVNEDKIKPVYLIEEMDKVSSEVYKVRMPIIYSRTVVRALSKALASKMISKEVKEDNKALGSLVGFLGNLGQEASEKADLRSWQTMPGKAYVTLMKLPEGTHNIKLEYFGADNLLYTDEKIIEIKDESNDLELVESVYWD